MKTLNSVIKFKPMTADMDGLLDKNPDRGYRTELVMFVVEEQEAEKQYDARTVFANQSDREINEKLDNIFEIYFKKDVLPHNNLFLAYVYLTQYHACDLTENALRVIKLFFEKCREKRVKSMLRISYNNQYGRNWRMSEENRQLLASECADEETILKHIKQLKPLISEYSDTIHTISNGFIGFVGEMAKAYQYPVVDYPTVVKAIVEELCVPNGLFFSIREPDYKNELLAEDPYYEFQGYISHNNDAMYGEQPNKDWRSGTYWLGHPAWQQVIDEGAYTPQDGEMFTIGALVIADEKRPYNPRIPSGLQMIIECAHHRHTSMSNWHCYTEALSPNSKFYKDNVMLNWQKHENITPELLDFNRIIYDPEWFYNEKGERIDRNPYEFLRDHLGYRLVAQSVNIYGKDEFTVELKLKNYGFAAAFYLESSLAVLDENYNVVSEIKVGDPESWYSHDPENYLSTEVLEHKVFAEFEAPEKEGKYYIAFGLKNTMGEAARLANANIPFENGYNILKSFDV